MTTLCERARAAARAGYAISENIYARGLYNIHRPDGHTYQVDAAGESPTCTCPASVPCKHVGLVEIARRYWLALERKAAVPTRTRRHFSRKHIEQMRSLAPCASPAAAEIVTITTPGRRILSADEFRRRMDSDFGPARAA